MWCMSCYVHVQDPLSDSGSWNVALGPLASVVPGNSVELQILWSNPKATDSGTLGRGPTMCAFPSPPGASSH